LSVDASQANKPFNLVLTGGRAAKLLYENIAKNSELFCDYENVCVYTTDERCVQPWHDENNFSMIKVSLFPRGLPKDITFHRMRAETEDLNAACDHYSALLPDSLDVLLLSMGEDGHIASLFPHSPALLETEGKVVPVTGPKAPYQRLTITPPVIQSAKQVYVLAIGDEKRCKYEEVLLDPEDISSIPARLVLDRTWIFDLDKEIDLCRKL